MAPTKSKIECEPRTVYVMCSAPENPRDSSEYTRLLRENEALKKQVASLQMQLHRRNLSRR